MRTTLRLYEPAQAHKALLQLWVDLKPWLLAEHRFELQIRPERRSTEANAKFHAMLSEIAEQVPWAGKHRDIECWKRLTVSSWLRAEGESIEVLPALDGKGIDIVYAPTSKLSRAQMASLIDYVSCWGAEQGVRFSAPEESPA